jgi:hypothetical protein
VAALAAADSPVIDAHGSCGRLAVPVCRAAAIKDPSAREQALRVTIRQGLFSSDAARREQAFKYLAENSRWIDLRPYAETLEQFSQSDALHRGLWLLDDNELARSSREERLAAYRTAIQEGTVRLSRGRPLTREAAIAFAAAEGMTEPEPLATLFSPMVEERWKKSFGLEAVPALFQLGEGAKDVEDAQRIAASRLRAMNDEDFSFRMEKDEGFRAAVIQVARGACMANPFSGERNPGCADIRNVVQRQTVLEEQTRTTAGRSQGVGEASVTTKKQEDWPSQLRRYISPGSPY